MTTWPRLRPCDDRREVFVVLDVAQALAAAASGRFTMIGYPIFFAIAATWASVSRGSRRTWTTGTPALDISLARFNLVAHPLDRVGRRSDPGEAGLLHCAGECGALGKKTVAGMNRVGLEAFRGFKIFRSVEVALGGWGRTDEVRMIGFAHVERGASRRRSKRRSIRFPTRGMRG